MGRGAIEGIGLFSQQLETPPKQPENQLKATNAVTDESVKVLTTDEKQTPILKLFTDHQELVKAHPTECQTSLNSSTTNTLPTLVNKVKDAPNSPVTETVKLIQTIVGEASTFSTLPVEIQLKILGYVFNGGDLAVKLPKTVSHEWNRLSSTALLDAINKEHRSLYSLGLRQAKDALLLIQKLGPELTYLDLRYLSSVSDTFIQQVIVACTYSDPAKEGEILSKLEHLFIMGSSDCHTTANAFISLPHLANLKVLHLDQMFTSSAYNMLPQEIGQLKMLKELTVNNSNITTIISWTDGFIFNTLEKLNITGQTDINSNLIITFPEGIDKFTGLKELSLSHTDASALPTSICSLTRLEKLHISDANLEDRDLSFVSGWVGSLPDLRDLGLIGYTVELLPEVLMKCRHLQKLSLIRMKNLTALPREVVGLKELKELNLSDNSLTTLPDWIDNFSQLEALDLSNCKALTELPPQIGKLVHLKKLNLDGCTKLVKIPVEIKQLKNLLELRLPEGVTL